MLVFVILQDKFQLALNFTEDTSKKIRLNNSRQHPFPHIYYIIIQSRAEPLESFFRYFQLCLTYLKGLKAFMQRNQ